MTEVVAALIWDKDRFLICQRPANKARGLLWEFVGGKVEAGETKEQALVRECREELDIILEVGSIVTTGKKKMSAQAVGGTVGHNPISIIIPCHRVVGADGNQTGYAGGIDRKRFLLELEGNTTGRNSDV